MIIHEFIFKFTDFGFIPNNFSCDVICFLPRLLNYSYVLDKDETGEWSENSLNPKTSKSDTISKSDKSVSK